MDNIYMELMEHNTSLTDKKNIQDHFILARPLRLVDCHGTSQEQKPDFASFLQDHHRKFQTYLNIPQWQEVLWGIEDDFHALDYTNLHLKYTSSFEAQALRQGYETKIKPLGMVGLIQTADNQLVFGIRTGVAMGGYLCNAPAGHCGPEQPGHNVVLAGFIEELETELGLSQADVTNAQVLGFQSDPDFGRGVNTVIFAQARVPYSSLVEMHLSACAQAHAAQQKGMSYNEVKDTLQQSGFINIDAHEHKALVAIPYKRDIITRIIETRVWQYSDPVSGTVKTAPVMDIGRGSLLMLLKSMQLPT